MTKSQSWIEPTASGLMSLSPTWLRGMARNSVRTWAGHFIPPKHKLHLLCTLCPTLSDPLFAAIPKYQLYPLFCLFLTTTVIPHSNSLSSISSPLNTRSIFFRSGARNTLFSLVGRSFGFFRVQYSLLENRHYESPTRLTMGSCPTTPLRLPGPLVNFNTLSWRKLASFCESPDTGGRRNEQEASCSLSV